MHFVHARTYVFSFLAGDGVTADFPVLNVVQAPVCGYYALHYYLHINFMFVYTCMCVLSFTFHYHDYC